MRNIRKVKVNVTKKDIFRAIKFVKITSNSPNTYCPIALSLHRHAGFGEAKVFLHYVVIGVTYIPLPIEIVTWIKTFDNRRYDKVKPISFTLEVPDEQ